MTHLDDMKATLGLNGEQPAMTTQDVFALDLLVKTLQRQAELRQFHADWFPDADVLKVTIEPDLSSAADDAFVVDWVTCPTSGIASRMCEAAIERRGIQPPPEDSEAYDEFWSELYSSDLNDLDATRIRDANQWAHQTLTIPMNRLVLHEETRSVFYDAAEKLLDVLSRA
jgi:hypothetical protein